jgi:hypothetical protein
MMRVRAQIAFTSYMCECLTDILYLLVYVQKFVHAQVIDCCIRKDTNIFVNNFRMHMQK